MFATNTDGRMFLYPAAHKYSGKRVYVFTPNT